MARRRGQNGYIEKKGDTYYVRYWTDVEGSQGRQHACARLCSVQDGWTASERERRAKELIQRSGADTEELFRRVEGSSLGVSFKAQAKLWLDHAKNRKRNPIKPKTAYDWNRHLEHWLYPFFEETSLSEVGNGKMRELVAHLSANGLGANSIRNITNIVKFVVASAVDSDGEPIFPRRWNHDYIDMPPIGAEKTPSFEADTITSIDGAASGWTRVLYALLGGSGLRAGEALGLELRHVAPDRRTLRVEQSAWCGQIQAPKTTNAYRTVHLCPALAAVLDAHIGSRMTGYLFCGRRNHPVSSQSNVLRRDLHPILDELKLPHAGLHAFRRFRVTWLRRNRVPEDLIRAWIGHASKSVTDDYSRLGSDADFARDCAESVGLGFELPEVVRTVRNEPEPPAPETSETEAVAITRP